MAKWTLGERLRRAREAKGLTQEALGRPELTKSFISLLEHDRARPSVETLRQLAERLGRPISYFLEGYDTVASRREVEVLDSRGRSEVLRRQYEAALSTFAEMRALAESHRDATMEMHAVVGAGEAFIGLRRMDDARVRLDDALVRAREAEDRLVESRALAGLGRVEHHDGRFPQAVTLYRAALAALSHHGRAEPGLHGEVWLLLGTALARMGHLAEAADAHRRAQEIADEGSRPEQAGGMLAALAADLLSGGSYDEALVCAERARALFEQHEARRLRSRVQDGLGMLLVQLGRPRDALEHFTASLAIKQKVQDSAGECQVLTELARCYFICGEAHRARGLAERALAHSRMSGLPDETARAQIVLGAVAAGCGDAQEAQRLLQEAAEHCGKAGMNPEIVVIYRELARLAAGHGRFREAAAHQERAFAALRGVGPHEVVAALNVSALMARSGDPAPQAPDR